MPDRPSFSKLGRLDQPRRIPFWPGCRWATKFIIAGAGAVAGQRLSSKFRRNRQQGSCGNGKESTPLRAMCRCRYYNCPDVVQALNVLAALNRTHRACDDRCALFSEVDARQVLAIADALPR